MSAGAAVQEALYLRTLLGELDYPQAAPTVISEDNQGCIALALNQSSAHRTRHIAVRHHFIRHHIENGEIDLRYLHTSKMVADTLTKALAVAQFFKFRRSMTGERL